MKHRGPVYFFGLLRVLFGWLLLGLIPAGAQIPLSPAPPDSLRELSRERRPPPLAPVVAPSDTLVRVGACPGRRVRVGFILFVGNNRTRERILRAELNFREGDSLTVADLPARLEANRRRLFNLQLFHAVLAQASCGGIGQLTVLFSVQERWYILPTPILSLSEDFNVWRTRPDRWHRLDYGLHLVDTNFRGRAEQLTANLQLGFNRKYELFYEAPGLGRRRRIGLGLGISYYQSRNLDYNIIGDRRLSLPGAEDGAFPIQRFYLTGGLRLRHTVQRSSAFDVSYHREQVSPLIYGLNPAYLLGFGQRQYLEAGLSTTINQRNTFAYPLTGRFLSATVAYQQFVGRSDRSPGYATLRGRYARYLSLGHQFYYAVGLAGQTRLFAARLAEADARALGYDALVRGYDFYVVEGRSYGVVQQGLSWRAWAPPPLRLPFINDPKIGTLPLAIYLNAFTDAGLAGGELGLPVRPSNQLPGRLQASVGAGVHFVTYYDRVFCLELIRTLTVYPSLGFFFRSSFPI